MRRSAAVRIDRLNGQSIQHPGENVSVERGDTLVLMVRGTRLGAGLGMPATFVEQARIYVC